MRNARFSKEVEMIEKGFCPICGAEIDINRFKDELSRKEFKISGMCQICQDETFNKFSLI